MEREPVLWRGLGYGKGAGLMEGCDGDEDLQGLPAAPRQEPGMNEYMNERMNEE